MPNEISSLLELQAVDAQLNEAAAHIRRLEAERARIEAKIVEEQKTLDAQAEDVHQLEHKSRMMNLEVDQLDEHIREYQHRLDTGIISFKEMEDLRAKIKSEHARMNQMEDEALQLMDSITEAQSDLESAKEALVVRTQELRDSIAEVNAGIEGEHTSISNLNASRKEIETQLSSYLISQYESLRRKFPDPIAQVDHAVCTGCKLKLSASTIERARGRMGIVACEHCSRILYVE